MRTEMMFPGEFESIFYKIIEESAYVLKEKNTLYRSRIYTEDDKFDLLTKNKRKRYKAYDRVNSYINLNGISRENRMNPQGVRCVYLSSDIATSIMEVEPNIDDVISVAKIEVKQDLKIVNLSHIFTMLDDEYDRYISLYTQLEISRDSFDIKYVFPQYIGQLCKKLGYDGIAYKSKYRNNGNVADDVGINFAIYSYKKCAPISSYPLKFKKEKKSYTIEKIILA